MPTGLKQLQMKQQCRYVMWIINWALQIQSYTGVPLGANKLVSKRWMKTDHSLNRRYMLFDIASVSWGKVFLDLLKLSNFLSLYPLTPKTKIICFLFQTMKYDWIWRIIFEKFITILNVSVNLIGVLFLQLVSIFEKVHSKFKILFTQELEMPEQQFNTVYAPICL